MKRIFHAAACVLLLLSSCIKDTIDDLGSINGIKGSPVFQVPLINSKIGLDKLIADAGSGGFSIVTDPDKRIIVKFGGRDSLQETQFIKIPQVDIDAEISIPAEAIPVFEATGSFQVTIPGSAEIETNNGEKVERIEIKDGVITTSITSQFKHDVTLTVTYPGLIKNGQPLVDHYNFKYAGSNQTIKHNISLADYLADFTSNGTTYNTVPYEISINLTRIPGNTTSANDMLIVDEQINLASYKRADGYFGEVEILDFVENQNLSLFDKKLDGNVFIKEPLIRLRVENTVGMPITGKFTNMYVESGNGNRVNIVINDFKDTFNLNYTTITGQTRITEYVIDKNNSNIDQVLSSAPQKISYTVNFTANAGGKLAENVLTDKSTIKVISSIELPLDVKILSYAMQETGGFKLDNTTGGIENNNRDIEWAEIGTDIQNLIPLNAFLQVYFEDTVAQPPVIIDSLFTTELPVPAAIVNADGSVKSAGLDYTSRVLPREQFDRISKANRYRLNVRLRTAELNGSQPFVTFYIDQKVYFKMGLKTKLNLNSK